MSIDSFSVITWPARLDTEHCYPPTEVVPIHLLSFLHAFELLGWQKLGQATGALSVAWVRSYDDGWSSDLAAQRFLRFNPQHHHDPLRVIKSIFIVAQRRWPKTQSWEGKNWTPPPLLSDTGVRCKTRQNPFKSVDFSLSKQQPCAVDQRMIR